ncbi:MAG TPA: hypothetical protein ENG03_01885 [Thioploca sp.]|nr:hypothetical protein [Thioploca sp.]
MNKIYQSLLILTALFAFNPVAYAEENTDSSSSPDGSSPSTSEPPDTDARYTNGYNDGLAAGMELCKKSPRACGISLYATSGRSEDEIKQETVAQCQDDPASCEIEVNLNTDGSTEEGRQQCLNNPADCDIEINQNTDGSTEEGRQQCLNNPADCDIEINQNTDGSTEEGRQQCLNDPLSCGISVNPNLNEAIQETKAQCQRDPASCGIEVNCPTPPDKPDGSTCAHSFFSLSEGQLYLPAVDVPTAFDGTVTTYKVQLKQMPGSTEEPFLFSVTNAVPTDE